MSSSRGAKNHRPSKRFRMRRLLLHFFCVSLIEKDVNVRSRRNVFRTAARRLPGFAYEDLLNQFIMDPPSSCTPPYKRLRLCLKRRGSPLKSTSRLPDERENVTAFAASQAKVSEENLKRPVCDGNLSGNNSSGGAIVNTSAEQKDEGSACGLRNIGNTCYLAVVIQLLRHLPMISLKLRTLAKLVADLELPPSPSLDLLLALDSLVTSMSDKESSPCSTSLLYEVPGVMLAALRKASPSFGDGGQHDAQECLQGIFGHLDIACQSIVDWQRKISASKGHGAEGLPPAPSLLKCYGEPADLLASSTASSPPSLPTSTAHCNGQRACLDGAPCPDSACATSASTSSPGAQSPVPRVNQNSPTTTISSIGDSSNGDAACSTASSVSGVSSFKFRKGNLQLERTGVRYSKRIRSNSLSQEGYGCEAEITSLSSEHQPIRQSDSTSSASNRTEAADMELPATDAKTVENIVLSCFQGAMLSITQCVECELQQSHTEQFTDLSVPVCRQESLAQSVSASQLGNNVYVAAHSLPWCIDQLLYPRSGLSGSDKYQCANCRCSTEAKMSYKLTSLPSFLFFHLKRFTTVKVGKSMSTVKKIHGNIATPLTLTLSKWCEDTCANRDRTYRLVSVIMHTGSHSSTGHYTVYCHDSRPCVHSPLDAMQSLSLPPCDRLSRESNASAGSCSLGNNTSDSTSIPDSSCTRNKNLSQSSSTAASSVPISTGSAHSVPMSTSSGCNVASRSTSTSSSQPRSSQCCLSGNGMDTSNSVPCRWLYFDDSTVRRVSEDDLVLALSPLRAGSKPSLSPYILCYAVT